MRVAAQLVVANVISHVGLKARAALELVEDPLAFRGAPVRPEDDLLAHGRPLPASDPINAVSYEPCCGVWLLGRGCASGALVKKRLDLVDDVRRVAVGAHGRVSRGVDLVEVARVSAPCSVWTTGVLTRDAIATRSAVSGSRCGGSTPTVGRDIGMSEARGTGTATL